MRLESRERPRGAREDAGGPGRSRSLDIMMAETNGYEVLEHLKASSELRGLPVIVISALDQMDSVTKCIELGAEGLSRRGSARAVKTS